MKNNKLTKTIVMLISGIAIVIAVALCARQGCAVYKLFTPQSIKEFILGFGPLPGTVGIMTGAFLGSSKLRDRTFEN